MKVQEADTLQAADTTAVVAVVVVVVVDAAFACILERLSCLKWLQERDSSVAADDAVAADNRPDTPAADKTVVVAAAVVDVADNRADRHQEQEQEQEHQASQQEQLQTEKEKKDERRADLQLRESPQDANTDSMAVSSLYLEGGKKKEKKKIRWLSKFLK